MKYDTTPVQFWSCHHDQVLNFGPKGHSQIYIRCNVRDFVGLSKFERYVSLIKKTKGLFVVHYSSY
jgi:hypothetical protein